MSLSLSNAHDIESHTDISNSFEQSNSVSIVLVDEVIASRIIKSTPASDKILNCFKKPGFKNFGSILSQLPYVETEPATHTL